MPELDEVAKGVYRISTYVEQFGMAFNQYLFADDQPLLYHAGMRGMYAGVREAAAKVVDPSRLRWVGMSHFESDECGAMNDWLAAAPQAEAVCTKVAAMVNLADFALRPPHGLGKKDVLETGRFRFRMRATPQLPHGWDAGMLFEETQGILLCSDLFHTDGPCPAVSEADPLAAARQTLSEYQAGPLHDYMPYTHNTARQLAELAELEPKMLATMHGPAYVCDGRAALLGLADVMRDVLGELE